MILLFSVCLIFGSVCQLFRETLSEKSTKLHKSIPKGSMGRRIELLHVLNTNEIYQQNKREFQVFFLFRHVETRRLAPLKFRRIFLTQSLATVKVKLQI